MKSDFTLFINSSDSFEDCWYPFFKLLTIYWPQHSCPIILNTEFKDYDFLDLRVQATKAHSGTTHRKLTWSECLLKGLEMVESPLVLYMQEDYFLESQVLHEHISDFSTLMMKDRSIKYIGLTNIGNKGPFKPYIIDKRLNIVGNTKYRISTQAGLWRKETLISYLREHENGWMFEIFGTERSKKRPELFLTSSRELFPTGEAIIQYTHTGIIKGKWHMAIPELFSKHKINMDFSKRGFYKAKCRILRKVETLSMLLKRPALFYKGIRGL